MRYSKQRELVLHTVEQLCDHPTAEEIFDKAAPECPGLSLGTVYRNLNSLVEAGMVRRVSIPGRADRFDHTLCWHSHLYCTACGGVVRDTAYGADIRLRAAFPAGGAEQFVPRLTELSAGGLAMEAAGEEFLPGPRESANGT